MVGRLAAGLLGGHVRRRAGHEAARVQLASSTARARPKSVILTRSTPFSSRMLAGLMSRWMRPLGVGRRQPGRRLHADPQDFLERQGAVAVELVLERDAGDVLHHQIGQAVFLIDVVNRDDVIMHDGGGGAALAEEAAGGPPRCRPAAAPAP